MPEKNIEKKIKVNKEKREKREALKKENKKVIKERKTKTVTKPIINMMSKADMVKGQGVLAVYEELVKLAKECLTDDFDILVNASRKADIYHYHTINPEFIVSMPSKSSDSYSVGFVHFLPETVEESLDLPELFRDVFDFYLIQFYKMMDYLVVVNPCFIKPLVDYGIDREAIVYIPNFVSDKDFFPLGEKRKKEIREKYGIDKDKFTILGVGQLQTRKGVIDFAKMAMMLPDIEFVWAGGFSFSVMSEGYKELKKLTEEPPKNLHFIGIVEREEMNDIYNMADVMCLPSYAELFPMAILEAMSVHKPILLRDLDIYPDILFDFYLKANDVDSFVSEIVKLKEDDEYYAEAKAKAINGSKYYAREHVAMMWRDFYKMVLRDGSKLRSLKKERKKEEKKRKSEL